MQSRKMLRSVAFAAAAATCLAFSLPDGIIAGKIHPDGVSAFPAYGQGAESSGVEQPIQAERPKTASPGLSPASLAALFSLAGLGIIGLFNAFRGFMSSNNGASKGRKHGGWDPANTPEKFAERNGTLEQERRLPNPPGTSGLSPQEVIKRIKRMSQLVGWIAEADERGDSGDSAGGVLGHRLREAHALLSANKGAEFSANVDAQDIAKFKELMEEMLEAIKRHYPDYSMDDIWYEDASP